MARSVKGLDGAGEWPLFQALLPELVNKRVLDLGCGFGWHCRYAREQKAHPVIGVDISEKMLQITREKRTCEKIDSRHRTASTHFI